ncbi:hypothetical protein E4U61_006668 [Claviceps capensis]|nr:hypothetical protein E4U61_006668 [Claviceps capensis]
MGRDAKMALLEDEHMAKPGEISADMYVWLASFSNVSSKTEADIKTASGTNNVAAKRKRSVK